MIIKNKNSFKKWMYVALSVFSLDFSAELKAEDSFEQPFSHRRMNQGSTNSRRMGTNCDDQNRHSTIQNMKEGSETFKNLSSMILSKKKEENKNSCQIL